MKKILVVEDNDQNRLLVVDVLKFHGYEVIEAVDGESGIKKAKELKPDLIFMDLQLPVINGFDATKAIKSDAETKHIKIVAMTSFAMESDKERGIEAGCNCYIAKPIDTRELPKLVKRLIG